MHIDDLMVRIRRLPSAKRKKLEEIVRSLEESPPEAAPATTGSAVKKILSHLGMRTEPLPRTRAANASA
jgi:hypothetical protein